jgi:hypothetical protein
MGVGLVQIRWIKIGWVRFEALRVVEGETKPLPMDTSGKAQLTV